MGDQLANITFVGEIEKHQLLYNKNLPEYSNRELTDKAWREVGIKVNMSACECKERWRNLRSVFVRHMKPSPHGSGNKSKKPYYLSEAMKFMLPYMKTVDKPGGNLCKVARESNESNRIKQLFDISQEMDEGDEDLSIREAPSSVSTARQNQNSSEDRTSHSIEMKQEPGFGKRKDLTRKRNEQFSTDEDFANPKKKKLFTTSNGTGLGKQAFLLSLLPEIEPMTDVQMKLFRRRVLQLIDDIVEFS